MLVLKEVGDIVSICCNYTLFITLLVALKNKSKWFTVLGCDLYGTPCSLSFRASLNNHQAYTPSDKLLVIETLVHACSVVGI
jgi:hypothetical protein